MMRTSGPHHDKETNLSLKSVSKTKKCILDVGLGLLAASVLAFSPLDAEATRIEVSSTVIGGLDQGILGGEVVLSMQEGGKHKLHIPPLLAYGPEPAGCFSDDCNIPGNSTLLYDINFVGV
ncbi:hypothetical protein POTOM_028490 [Populus tomentosa]|uniref:peptidylprolyl isomerase n=1 Tax=Populus tomentosa TaxID=118781 RepID=A0A8X7ZAH6_POPTO|nr:hypothetical protein POTOM_028490 [Populus tomentosa]